MITQPVRVCRETLAAFLTAPCNEGSLVPFSATILAFMNVVEPTPLPRADNEAEVTMKKWV